MVMVESWVAVSWLSLTSRVSSWCSSLRVWFSSVFWVAYSKLAFALIAGCRAFSLMTLEFMLSSFDSAGTSKRMLLSSSDSVQVLVLIMILWFSLRWNSRWYLHSHFHREGSTPERREATVSKLSSNMTWNWGLMWPVLKLRIKATFEAWFFERPR